MISQTSRRVNSMPASWAMAGRCRPPLVEPPVAATTTAAFSNASRVQMSRGRMLRSSSFITALPVATAYWSRSREGPGKGGGRGRAKADGLGHAGHGVGGVLAAAGAISGAGVLLQVAQVLQAH